MDFGNTFIRFWQLLANTSGTWTELASQTGNTKSEDFRFLHTILLIDGIAALIGCFINGHTVVSCILNAFFSPAVFYATMWIMFFYVKQSAYSTSIDGKPFTSTVIFRLAIYSISLNILINATMVLLPGLFFMWILSLYSAYLIWEGLGKMLEIGDDYKPKPTLIMTLILILTPPILNFFLHLLIPGAK